MLAAGVGARWWSTLDEAVGMLRVTNRVPPDTRLAPLYDARFGTFRGLYDTLRPVFQQIAAEPAPPHNASSHADGLPPTESPSS